MQEAAFINICKTRSLLYFYIQCTTENIYNSTSSTFFKIMKLSIYICPVFLSSHSEFSYTIILHFFLIWHLSFFRFHIHLCSFSYTIMIYFNLLTYCCSVFPNQPTVVAEEWQDANEEHRRYKEKKKYVEFGTCIWEFILRKENKKC